MNFFAAQDRARHNTAWLVLLFVAALAGLIVALYAAAHFFLLSAAPSVDSVDFHLLGDVAVGVLAVVSIGTIYKTLVLAAGGGAGVAESLGGKPISPSTANPEERRLLNIVDEMAIASGCPPPQVYLIPDDNINAFAAGTKIGDAVIGMTRGAMRTLSREEMQGVVAHEFSHIMNGDMRLNLRLIGIIHGIMLLSYLGYFVLRSSWYASLGGGRNNAAAVLPLAGLALLVAGSAGAFCGGLIRAAVSRQREYLADAAAVQYTRNPRGIGGALQKIGLKYGLLKNPNAAECAHLFFAPGVSASFANMFASHPPIEKRIKRILPDWDGDSFAAAKPAPKSGSDSAAVSGFAANAAAAHSPPPAQQTDSYTKPAAAEAELPDLFAALFGEKEPARNIVERAGVCANQLTARKLLDALPPSLRQATADSYSARALVYALLLERGDDRIRRAQCDYLRANADNGVYDLTMLIAPDADLLPRPARLPILLRSLPALRMMSPAQYAMFKKNVGALISIDEKITVFEWSIEAALEHYLESHFGDANRAPAPAVRDALSRALSVAALAGHPDNAAEVFAAQTANINPRPFYIPDGFSPPEMTAALRRLDGLPPAQKRAFLCAAADIVAHDGAINADEGALLRAFAAVLDCPVPPLFANETAQ